MADANGELRGVVRGRTIELESDPGLPEGAAVSVVVQGIRATLTESERRDRFLRAAGAWSGDDEEGLDEYLRQCRQDRQASRPEIED